MLEGSLPTQVLFYNLYNLHGLVLFDYSLGV